MAASPNAGAQRAQQVDEDAQGEGDVQAEPADVQGDGHEGDQPELSQADLREARLLQRARASGLDSGG